MAKPVALFYFSSIPYGYLHQRPQQLFHCFQKLYPEIDVFYVEPPRGIRSFLKGGQGPATPGVLNGPLTLPVYFSAPGAARFSRWSLERMLASRVKSGSSCVAIACASLWEPLLSRSFFDLICYDCLDALEVHAAADRYAEVAHKHAVLIDRADMVFVTAARLREDIVRHSPGKPVLLVSNGVDGDFFAQSSHREIAFPTISGKVAGYVGAVRDWIDIDLIAGAAKMLPELTFVMVGPVAQECAPGVQGCPDNVLFVGEQPYQDVPAWIERFDVALIPFKASEIAESTNPIKLYEYFQLGKPVVSTTMRELAPFRDQGLLHFADNPADFSAAIGKALNGSLSQAKRRKEIAGANSWQSKAMAVIEQIKPRLP